MHFGLSFGAILQLITTDGMAEIILDSLSYAYPDSDTDVLHNISLTIPDGQFACILGSSGCGKSTLIRLLSGLAMPRSGSISTGGVFSPLPGPDRAVVFQSSSLFPWMTVYKNVLFGIKQARPSLSCSEAAEQAEHYLKAVGLEGDLNKYPFQLSGGMQQRCSLARAFAMDSDILLLDEPFSALDPRIRLSLQRMLESLWFSGEKHCTIVFVTHDISEAMLLADRIIFMSEGCIAADISLELPRPRDEASLLSEQQEIRRALAELYYSAGEVGL